MQCKELVVVKINFPHQVSPVAVGCYDPYTFYYGEITKACNINKSIARSRQVFFSHTWKIFRKNTYKRMREGRVGKGRGFVTLPKPVLTTLF